MGAVMYLTTRPNLYEAGSMAYIAFKIMFKATVNSGFLHIVFPNSFNINSYTNARLRAHFRLFSNP